VSVGVSVPEIWADDIGGAGRWLAGNAIDPLGWRFYDFGMGKPAKWMLMGLLVVMVALPAGVLAEDYQFATNGNAITITKYIGTGGAVTIPEKINGLSVTSVGYDAFGSCSSLTSVAIPNSVTSIGAQAFAVCANLTNVSISSSVTSIGGMAFFECHQLTSVTIPNSVANIGNEAFQGCTSLINLTIPNSVTNIGENAFGSCTSLANVTIPKNVTNTELGSVFADCTHLTAITVNTQNPVYSSVDGVLFNKQQTALIKCPEGKIEAIYTIPNGVTSVEEGAIGNCSRLASVTIPKSVTNIENRAFLSCANLTNLTVDAQNSYYKSLDGVLFNKSLTTLNQYPAGRSGGYTIPAKVASIGVGAFFCCTKLTSVTIPNSVTNIGETAFWNCNQLTKITIPKSVTSIGDMAFLQCEQLTSVAIPNSVTSIGVNAFHGCTNLISITIPASVISIGDGTFSECFKLNSITIPNSVTNIGAGAFSACFKLTKITVDAQNSVYSSMDGVLFNKRQTTLIKCPGGKIGNYTIPNTVTNIGGEAFGQCFRLVSVTIPKSLTSIAGWAFADCTGLRGVYFKGDAPNLDDGQGGFTGRNGATIYYLPETKGWGKTFGDRHTTAVWKQ